MLLGCVGFTVGCIPDGTGVSATVYEDPDTTGPGPWVSGGDWEMDQACEQCPEEKDENDELIVGAVTCQCNLPVGGGTKWEDWGTACGTKNMFGYWKETDDDPEPYLEDLCGYFLAEALPLLETEFHCQPIACNSLEEPTGYSCSGWDPDGMVIYSGGDYYMDAYYVTSLIYDFLPLIFCDDARFQALENGGFEVVDADDGELLYELGLRDGDIPLELNGYPLDDIGDVGEAFAELWVTDGEDTFDLYILRGVNYITLDYFMVYTL